VFVALYSWDIPYHLVISRETAIAMGNAADRIISNRQASRKVFCVMTLRLYRGLIWLAGEEQPPMWLLFLIG
jgi:hypothetical protein